MYTVFFFLINDFKINYLIKQIKLILLNVFKGKTKSAQAVPHIRLKYLDEACQTLSWTVLLLILLHLCFLYYDRSASIVL